MKWCPIAVLCRLRFLPGSMVSVMSSSRASRLTSSEPYCVNSSHNKHHRAYTAIPITCLGNPMSISIAACERACLFSRRQKRATKGHFSAKVCDRNKRTWD
ncbi:uncharacterized protein EKO05_0007271 [Ascochyta rabiei]|uniref:uncharacterized protein n=1 Tax=Didymella rabiei TaxID=5454 RepID=UPI0022039161|nr:uncharacterized protein EKO05_0007271 [Ascochyta rabiei]UPX16889.1 hypothetical protein EKO05_0007271 [Ascochyta rabiei]